MASVNMGGYTPPKKKTTTKSLADQYKQLYNAYKKPTSNSTKPKTTTTTTKPKTTTTTKHVSGGGAQAPSDVKKTYTPPTPKPVKYDPPKTTTPKHISGGGSQAPADVKTSYTPPKTTTKKKKKHTSTGGAQAPSDVKTSYVPPTPKPVKYDPPKPTHISGGGSQAPDDVNKTYTAPTQKPTSLGGMQTPDDVVQNTAPTANDLMSMYKQYAEKVKADQNAQSTRETVDRVVSLQNSPASAGYVNDAIREGFANVTPNYYSNGAITPQVSAQIAKDNAMNTMGRDAIAEKENQAVLNDPRIKPIVGLEQDYQDNMNTFIPANQVNYQAGVEGMKPVAPVDPAQQPVLSPTNPMDRTTIDVMQTLDPVMNGQGYPENGITNIVNQAIANQTGQGDTDANGQGGGAQQPVTGDGYGGYATPVPGGNGGNTNTIQTPTTDAGNGFDWDSIMAQILEALGPYADFYKADLEAIRDRTIRENGYEAEKRGLSYSNLERAQGGLAQKVWQRGMNELNMNMRNMAHGEAKNLFDIYKDSRDHNFKVDSEMFDREMAIKNFNKPVSSGSTKVEKSDYQSMDPALRSAYRQDLLASVEQASTPAEAYEIMNKFLLLSPEMREDVDFIKYVEGLINGMGQAPTQSQPQNQSNSGGGELSPYLNRFNDRLDPNQAPTGPTNWFNRGNSL